MIKKKTVVSCFSGLILTLYSQDTNNGLMNRGHNQIADIVKLKNVKYSDAILAT